MKILNSFIGAIMMLVIGCAETQKNGYKKDITIVSSDSLELLTLTKKLLKWSSTNSEGDFIPKSNNDTVYIGINWSIHKLRVKELINTDFFSQDFIESYENIAHYLDIELKENKIKYYKGEITPYGNGASEWCNCQDYPSSFENKLKIRNIKQVGNITTFYWTWDDESSYMIKVKKENKRWLIIYLEGFNIKNFIW